MKARLMTARLLLRPQEVADAPIFHRLWSERDPRIPSHRRPNAEGRPTVNDIAGDIRTTGSTSQLFTVVLRDSAEVIGYAGLVFTDKGGDGEPEIAFELLERVHGQGYATEAGHAIMSWARKQGHARLWASVWDWNLASRRVLEKLGFIDCGRAFPPTEHGRTILTVRELGCTEDPLGERAVEMVPDRRLGPAANVRIAAELFGRDVVIEWCEALLQGSAHDNDPHYPDISCLSGRIGWPGHWSRVWGARGLLHLGPPAHADVVLDALDDPSWRVQEMALKVMIRHGMDDPRGRVEELAAGSHDRVRFQALRALGVPRADRRW